MDQHACRLTDVGERPVNFTLDPSAGTDQQKAWVRAALASCSYPLDAIEASVTVTWGACTSLNHAYMQTVPNSDGTFTITIEPWADDPTNPNNGGLSQVDLHRFYLESFVHELGHVVAYKLLGSDDLRTQVCGLFWTPASGGTGRRTGALADWAPDGYPWAKAIQEAVAEAFKVAYYTGDLVFGNRTEWYIDGAQWLDFAKLLAPPTGFRDDFSSGTMALDNAQGAMRLDARRISDGSDLGAPPTWWNLQESWFVRALGSLSIKTTFDDTALGLPSEALPTGYDWYSAGLNYFIGETDAGSIHLASPTSADAVKAVGILGVAAGLPFPTGLDPFHDAFTLQSRGGVAMAAFIGERPALVGGRLGVVTRGCRMVTRAWLPPPDTSGEPPSLSYWNEQSLEWADQDVYLRFEADNTTGKVTLSVTRDEAGTDVIGSMTDDSGLHGDSAPLCVAAHAGVSMYGPLLLPLVDPAPPPTQRLFALIQWNYQQGKPAPYPSSQAETLKVDAAISGYVPVSGVS